MSASDLRRVLGLVEAATPGPWRASEHCSLIYNSDNLFAASAGDTEKFAIAAAVNFLRQHGPALLEALADRERLDWLIVRHGDGYEGIEFYSHGREGDTTRQAIDYAMGIDPLDGETEKTR